MDVQVESVYRNSYLNIISALFKKLGLPQLIDHLVPVDPQCQTRVSDAVQAIIYNLFDGRQALVHVERWAQEIDLEKLIRSGLHPSQLNDDALTRHLDRLYEAGIYRVFQRRVRPFMTPEHPLKGPGGRKLTRPTGQAIFQLFPYVNVVLFKLPDGRIQRSLDRSLTPDQRRILQGLGMDESIYV
ncbi:DUF4277 domain-containing protein [Geobacillus stearothermophilus]|uniref:DUF4277 domain-containing protein n=1 Tax=Geobacillus stearothermophilus TaxID=1422 RepID=UPI003D24360F